MADRMFSPKERQSRAIEVLRFPLAVMVVAIHCYYFNTQKLNHLELDGQTGIMISAVHSMIDLCSIVLTDCAVPLFFVVSGYLYFLKKPDMTMRENFIKIKNKCITLGLPYIVWNVMGVLAYPGRFIEADATHRLLGFWSTNFKIGGWAGPWDGPLWFVRDLFVVMLFAPLLSFLIRRYGVKVPLVFLILYIFHYEAVCPGLTTVSFLFFSIGAILSIRWPDFSDVFARYKVRASIVSIAFGFFILRCGTMNGLFVRYSWDINAVWIFSSTALYFMIASKIGITTAHFDRWKRLGAASFVIFAMHSLIIGRISSGLLWLVGKENVGSGLTLLFYIITISLSVAICYFVHLLIAKSRITALLFEGGRTR